MSIEREKKREMYHNNILWQKSATPWTRDHPWSHEPSPACESAEDVHVTAPVKWAMPVQVAQESREEPLYWPALPQVRVAVAL